MTTGPDANPLEDVINHLNERAGVQFDSTVVAAALNLFGA